MSTDGVKYVAEEGDCSFLEEEIDTCLMGGYCADDGYFSWGCDGEEGSGSGVCTHSDTITVTPEYSYVSMVTMAVPSPDWFVGASNVNLCQMNEDGEYYWVDQYPEDGPKILYAYDAGTDSGETFLSENAEVEPRESITVLDARNESNIFYNEEEEMLYPLCELIMEKM